MHCTQKVQKWSLKSHVLKHIDNIKQFQLQFYERHQCAINNCIRNIVLDWQLLSNAQLMYGSQVCLYFTKCMIIKFKTSSQVKGRIIVRTVISSSLNSTHCRDIRESTRERSHTCAACVEERLLTNPPYADTPW